jgi:plasmid stabilization system protein ParE
MILVILAQAQRDLTEIYEFIARDSRPAARETLERITGIIRQLADGELKGPEIALRTGRRVRRWSVPPYWIYYRRTEQRTVVLRVYHQARWPLE